nr:hypothetical protein [Bacteroidota bacterium]
PGALGVDDDQIYPDIAFDGEKYLVVWDDNRSGSRDIYGQFVDTEGNLIGDDIVITSHGADQLLVQVAFGGSNFFAVWGDERLSSNDKGIFGQLIGLDGELIGENLSISPPTNSEGRTWPDIVASDNEYLAVWDQEWLEYKEGQDEKSMEDYYKCLAAGVSMPRPIVWYDIYARKISFAGELISEELPVCTFEYHQQDCNVTSDGTDFLVTWSDSRNNNQYYDIYGYILEGTPMPDPPYFNPEGLEFTTVSQVMDGLQFCISNPNDVDVLIDSIYFIADENHYWFLLDQPEFPILIMPEDSAQLSVTFDMPVGGLTQTREFLTDTMVALTMNSEIMMDLKIDEQLYDTIFNPGELIFEPDSLFFETVNQALDGETVVLTNPHTQNLMLESAFVSGPWGNWNINPGIP